MNNILSVMLEKYDAISLDDKKNAIKEIVQEIVLCGLARGRFFEKAAFYGGTALRIFHGLDRFSEDLDFSLVNPDADFCLSDYFPMLEKEIASFGLHLSIEEKVKCHESAIKSAFLKGDTKEHLLLFYADHASALRIPNGERLRIKFEVDTNPPAGATFQHQFNLHPVPYEVTLYDIPSLFAGKIHAVLCRSWQERIKGRDLFDYIFYLQKKASVNLEHLRQRLIQSNRWEDDRSFSLGQLKQMLMERFEHIDYEKAKDDVVDFIKDKASLDLWKPQFFKAITDNLLS